ncbi:MAG TPA: efflux RND transporter periplasmic adaptor subunit [Candidatus Kryptonia bacterium]
MEAKNADLSSLRIDRSKRDPGQQSGSSAKKIFTIAIPAIVIVAAAIAVSRTMSGSPMQVKAITVVQESPSQSQALLTASGYVVAQRKAAIASKATGRLVYLGVVEGDKVKKGQVIGRLEDSDVKAQLDEANANLELYQASLADAKWNYDRDKDLLKSGSITQSTFQTAETQYKKAQASVDVAKANVEAAEVAVENTVVRAPFDGTVLTKNADVGEIVAPMAGSVNTRGTVVTIADMGSLQVEADVSESNIEKVRIDQPCEITLDAYPNVQYDAYVAKIVPTADRGKATVTVKVAFRNYDSRVLPEMSAKVTFLGLKDTTKGDSSVLMIPSTAVLNKNGKSIVYMIVNDKAVETTVTLGRSFGNYVGIAAGLSNGDKVIDSPGDQITNGLKVTEE